MRILLTMFLLLFGVHEVKAANWQLMNVEWNKGPLDCDLPGGMVLNWAEVASGWDATVQFESDGNETLNLGLWKTPKYIPETGQIYMEIGAQALRRDSAGRIRVFRKANPNDAANSGVGTAQIVTGRRTAYTTVKVAPWTDVPVYYLEVWYSNGGTCSSWLARYAFQQY